MPGNTIRINGSEELTWYIGDSKMEDLKGYLDQVGLRSKVDENKFKLIAEKVALQWDCGGFSDGIYYDYALEILKRYIGEEEANYCENKNADTLLLNEITKILVFCHYENLHGRGETAKEIQDFEKHAMEAYLGSWSTFRAKVDRDVASICLAIGRYKQIIFEEG